MVAQRVLLCCGCGLAAVRFIIALREWCAQNNQPHLLCLLLVAPQDQEAMGVALSLADGFIPVPDGPSAANYGNVECIIVAAKRAHVDAVWPGWGHASENPELSRQLKQQGIVFLGPGAEAMETLGDKVAAALVAQTVGIPTVPWNGSHLRLEKQGNGKVIVSESKICHEFTPPLIIDPETCKTSAAISSIEEGKLCAERIGYPVFLKASTKGGGHGIRRIVNSESFASAYAQVEHEAPGAPLMVTCQLTNVRHIEVQLLADQQGHVVPLFGRDCSVQRRHQKVFEEAPAIIPSSQAMLAMERAAVRLAKAVGYYGAGTVEFLYSAETDQYVFLELNPRLQVEHPCTEFITGINLPAAQWQIAMGKLLSEIKDVAALFPNVSDWLDLDALLKQRLVPRGHVIAARLTAEDASKQFQPSSGKVHSLLWQPNNTGTGRIFAYYSCTSGTSVHTFADSQIGHIFSFSETRDLARKQLIVALQESSLQIRSTFATTQDALRKLLQTETFSLNRHTTEWLDGLIASSVRSKDSAHPLVLSEPQNSSILSLCAAVVEAHLQYKKRRQLLLDQLQRGQIPSMADVEALNQPNTVTFYFWSSQYVFEITPVAPSQWKINDKIIVTCEALNDKFVIILPNYISYHVYCIQQTAQHLQLHLNQESHCFYYQEESDRCHLLAPSAGKLVHFLVADNALVQIGDSVLEWEAMKVCATLTASHSGHLRQLKPAGVFLQGGDVIAHIVPINEKKRDESVKMGTFPYFEETTLSLSEKMTLAVSSLSYMLQGYLTNAKESWSQLKSYPSSDVLPKVIQLLNQFIQQELPWDNDASADTRMMHLCRTHSSEEALILLFAQVRLQYRLECIQWLLHWLQSQDKSNFPHSLQRCLKSLTQLTLPCYRPIVLSARLLAHYYPQLEALDSDCSNALRTQDRGQIDALLVKGKSLWLDQLHVWLVHAEKAVRLEAMLVYVKRMFNWKECNLCGDYVSWTFEYENNEILSALMIAEQDINILANTHAEYNWLYVVCKDKLILNQLAPFAQCVQSVTLITCNAAFPSYHTYTGPHFQENTLLLHMDPILAPLYEFNRLAHYAPLQLCHLDPSGRIHVYLGCSAQRDRRLFARVLVRPDMHLTRHSSSFQPHLAQESETLFSAVLDALDVALAQHPPCDNNLIFMSSLTPFDTDSQQWMQLFQQFLLKFGRRLLQLRVSLAEIRIILKQPNNSAAEAFRFICRLDQGWRLRTDGYREVIQQGKIYLQDLSNDEKSPLLPYPPMDGLQDKRYKAKLADTTYVYDIPALLEEAARLQWEVKNLTPPMLLLKTQEMDFNTNNELVSIVRDPGQNKSGIVVWLMTLYTPETPQGRPLVVISNDIVHEAGVFGLEESRLFTAATEWAHQHGFPRLFLSANAGAKMGLAKDVLGKYRISFTAQEQVDYLYLTEEDYSSLSSVVQCERKYTPFVHYKLLSITGQEHGLNVENLKGSAQMARATSLAYHDGLFTLSLVTARSVGIGAYLLRLGHRVIQEAKHPIILTGVSALNKVLSRPVYASNLQLGGPQVMHNNGISHLVVQSTLEGLFHAVQWLSFVRSSKQAPVQCLGTTDPLERELKPISSTLQMIQDLMDRDSFVECMTAWAQTVILGRARLGGVSCGVLAVETRGPLTVTRPADPADLQSAQSNILQAPQVFYPDSAYKTAQAMQDLAKEQLPLILLANWRGFSGGVRDMFDAILKFGSMIVEQLTVYPCPVLIYLGPGAELRGGAWVVFDKAIQPRRIEIMADPLARGGILEPEGLVEIKYRKRLLLETMHRLDPECAKWINERQNLDPTSESYALLLGKLEEREELLMERYRTAAVQFAALHDTAQRMLEVGVIDAIVPWKEARSVLGWRLKRRVLEVDTAVQLQRLIPRPFIMSMDEAEQLLSPILPLKPVPDSVACQFWNEQNIIDLLEPIAQKFIINCKKV